MSLSVQQGGNSSTALGNTPDPSLSASFKTAVAGNSTGGLAVTGNQIDTGRYIITGSTSYTRPTDGGHANDGMVTIYDKTNQSYVDVYGDPHVYTSSGDRANFQADGLTINLGDGTQVQFKPTAETNGVSHLDSIAVTKNNQTVIQSGYYSASGKGSVSTGPVTQGGPTTAQGFNDTRDTVLSVGQAGSLGTLVNTFGAQLSSKNYEDALDGMGGGFAAFADTSGIKTVQAYGSALADNAGKSGGPNAANEPSQAAASTIPGNSKLDATPATQPAATSDLTSLLTQLIALLQQQAPASETPTTAATQTPAGTSTPTQQPAGSNDMISLLQQLIGLLQQLGSTATPEQAALIKQLLPLLQQQLAAGATTGGSDETALLKQILATLQPQGATKDAIALDSVPASYNPATGISGQEVNAMMAHSNGTGPEVQLSAYDKAAASYDKTAPSSTAVPQSYNPAMGISGDEITAMLANANGTGPAVNFSDYDKAAATYAQSESSSTPANQPASV